MAFAPLQRGAKPMDMEWAKDGVTGELFQDATDSRNPRFTAERAIADPILRLGEERGANRSVRRFGAGRGAEPAPGIEGEAADELSVGLA